VVVPSGYNNADGKGYLFMLNPRTGALLQKVSTGEGSLSNSAGLAHANGYVTDYSDGTIDAVYAGDLLGNIWRWDVTATSTAYPTPIKLAALTDSSIAAKPQPITARPLVEVHPNLNKRFVLVGTGRLLDSSDIASTQPQTFYAITDGSGAHFNAASDLPTGITFPITRAVLAANTNALVGVTYDPSTQMGWYEELGLTGGIGWRVTSDATSLLNQVAWAATLPNGDACNPSGSSRVYARDFGTSVSTIGTRVGTTFTPELYKSLAGMVTDLRYVSVNGKATLISGTDSGGVQKLDTAQPTTPGLRRLNWRELQTVE
jgi:type IV pilus assembly protein PilY1